MKHSVKIWERMTVVLATLLVITYTGSTLAFSQRALINSVLKIKSYELVSGSDDGEGAIYYPAAYATPEEVKAYGMETGATVEAEGIVLLKNENGALPLRRGDRVSPVFYGSAHLNYATSGSSAADSSAYQTLLDALETEEIGLSVNPELWRFYTEGDGAKYKPTKKLNRSLGIQVYSINAAPWSSYESVQDSFSAYGDAAIAVISRASGEGMDISTVASDGLDGSYLSLSAEEMEVLSALSDLKEQGIIRKIVVLLNSALAVRADFVSDPALGIDACLWIGNLGSSGVQAVAEVLAGSAVPSGRLADTYVKDNWSSPAMASWILNRNGVFSQEYLNADEAGLNSTQRYYGVYSEGIYVGYRYYETRYEDAVTGRENTGNYRYADTVAFPFGYGLSYTTFAYSGFQAVREENGDWSVSLTVTNTGDAFGGKEVVQIYLQKPYTAYDTENRVEKASVELAGFAKTAFLAPGESETVTVPVEWESFKSYDAYGAGTYILDEGDYYLAAGRNAHDALNNILAAKGFSAAQGMDAEGDESLAAMVYHQEALDTKTWAVSKETGAEIRNQLDFADINRYEGSGENRVTYVSRSDWTGTWPVAPVDLTAGTERMLDDLSSNKPLSDDGSAMPVYGAQNGLTLMMLRSSEENRVPFDDPMWEDLLDELTFSEQALLTTDGSFSTHALPSVALSGTSEQDGPTGVVGSVTQLSYPSEGIWASSFNLQLIARVGDALAEDARINDLEGMYLPGINIHRTPFGGRTHEYFSEDPYLSGAAAAAEIRALQAKGVVAHTKHFILNDEEAQRNGICIWLNEQAAREIYLRPWEWAVNPSRGNSHAAMSSFNRAGCLWTSASEALVQNILRGEMGFDGYIITDMASSNAAYFMTYVDGFMNGTDLYLGAGGESVLDEYRNNPAFCSKIREASHRILYVLGNYSAAMNGMSSSLRVRSVTPWWGLALNAAGVVLAVLFLLSGWMWIVSARKKRIRKA